MENHEKLHKIVSDNLNRMDYKDKANKTRSGMTKLQEYFKRNGIREHRDDEAYDKKKYVATQHPLPWTCEGYYGRNTTYSLLFPKELAIRILTLETMP